MAFSDEETVLVYSFAVVKFIPLLIVVSDLSIINAVVKQSGAAICVYLEISRIRTLTSSSPNIQYFGFNDANTQYQY